MPKSQHLRWPGREPDDGPDAKIRRLEDPLDSWLKRELTKLYAGVLEEPLPPALAELLQEYEKKLLRAPPAMPEKKVSER